MTFEHFILTRFTLSYFEGIGKANLREEYLDYRFSLFENYCLPSVKGQTCQNFKWLVLFCKETPIKYKTRIENISHNYKNLIPCYIDDTVDDETLAQYMPLNEEYEYGVSKLRNQHYNIEAERPSRTIVPCSIKKVIDKLSPTAPDFYVTTRLDNDDAIHKEFVAIIQQKVRDLPKHAILDFPNTYKYIEEEGVLYKYTLENGHFITLIEPSNRVFQSVLYWNHLFADKLVETKHFYQNPLQLEIIHKKNVVNAFTEVSFRGILNGFRYFRGSDYGLKSINLSVGRSLYICGSLIKEKLSNRKELTSLWKKYIWPLPKYRREMVVMVNSPGHGGLTDRIRNILSVYHFCKLNNIPFRIYHTYPFRLEQILLPNKYNWIIKDSDLSYSIYDSKDLFLWVDLQVSSLNTPEVCNNRHLEILTHAINDKKKIQYHIHGNSYLAEGHYKELFFELFKPAPVFQERIAEVEDRLPKQYEAITLRFQNLLNDFKEYDFEPLPTDMQKNLISNCIDKIQELHGNGYFATNDILVTSDSCTFLEKINRLSFVHVFHGKRTHIDNIEGSSLEAGINSFVDFYLLMKARRVTLLLTDPLYHSGFPKMAAEIGGGNYNELFF